MDKDIQVIDKGGRPAFDFSPKVLQQIQDLASYMCTKEEVANIIGCHRTTLYRNEQALEAYDKGVNVAKRNIRKTQFDIATKLLGTASFIIFTGSEAWSKGLPCKNAIES